MEKVTKEPTKHITQQWVKLEHYEAFVKCSKFRPDLSVKITEVAKDDSGLLVHCRMTFTNIGRNLYMQRVIHFICTSLTEYQTEHTPL
jgi:hypothetical protein